MHAWSPYISYIQGNMSIPWDPNKNPPPFGRPGDSRFVFGIGKGAGGEAQMAVLGVYPYWDPKFGKASGKWQHRRACRSFRDPPPPPPPPGTHAAEVYRTLRHSVTPWSGDHCDHACMGVLFHPPGITESKHLLIFI